MLNFKVIYHDRIPDKHAIDQILSLSEIGMDIRDGEFRIGRFKRPAVIEFDGGEETTLREARKRKIYMTIDEYAKPPKVYPAMEIPPYKA